MIKRIGLLRRKKSLSYDQFINHWLRTHAELAKQLPGLHRYCINVIEREKFPQLDYDGFSELWFESEEALNAALKSPQGVSLLADLQTFTEDVYPVVVTEHRMLWPA